MRRDYCHDTSDFGLNLLGQSLMNVRSKLREETI